MPLRNPRYLNRTDFYDHAAYHDIDIPRRTEVVAQTSRTRKAAGKVGLQQLGIPVGFEGQVGNSVEFQSAYTLEMGEKSSFSKVLDAMEREDETALVKIPLAQGDEARWVASKGELVELNGVMKLSPVSSVGKIMNVMLQLVGREDVNLDDLFMAPPANNLRGQSQGATASGRDEDGGEGATTAASNIPAQAQEIFRAVYLRNEIPQIPALFELQLDEQDAPWRVYVNCDPGHFIGPGAAATDSIEGEVTVVGVIRDFVDDDPTDGFITTEPWTLHGWERTLRSILSIRMDELTKKIIPAFDPNWKSGDASYYIRGPVIIIDAVAIF